MRLEYSNHLVYRLKYIYKVVNYSVEIFVYSQVPNKYHLVCQIFRNFPPKESLFHPFSLLDLHVFCIYKCFLFSFSITLSLMKLLFIADVELVRAGNWILRRLSLPLSLIYIHFNTCSIPLCNFCIGISIEKRILLKIQDPIYSNTPCLLNLYQLSIPPLF